MANYGKTPFLDNEIFTADTITHSLSMMTVAGMYDYSGEYFHKYGFPAKSSVSGAVMIVIPNIMGICVWSPRRPCASCFTISFDIVEALARGNLSHVDVS